MRNVKLAFILTQLLVVAALVASMSKPTENDCSGQLGLRRQVAQWMLSVSTELRFERRACAQAKRAPAREGAPREPSWAPQPSRVQKFARVP